MQISECVQSEETFCRYIHSSPNIQFLDDTAVCGDGRNVLTSQGDAGGQKLQELQCACCKRIWVQRFQTGVCSRASTPGFDSLAMQGSIIALVMNENKGEGIPRTSMKFKETGVIEERCSHQGFTSKEGNSDYTGRIVGLET